MKKSLMFAAVAEAVTGLALLVAPVLVVRLLFGAEFTGVTIIRVTGIALIALGLACWPGPPAVGMSIIRSIEASVSHFTKFDAAPHWLPNTNSARGFRCLGARSRGL